jgi:hypothetical protein
MPRAGFWAIESHTIRFGKDGRWYADQEPISNQRITALFSKHVTRGADGEWWLVIGDERARIVVEDTPFVVTRVDGDPASGFRIRLNDGSEEPLETETLHVGAEDVLYCSVKQRAYAARFLRPAQIELLSHVREAREGYVLRLPNGRTQRIARSKRRDA